LCACVSFFISIVAHTFFFIPLYDSNNAVVLTSISLPCSTFWSHQCSTHQLALVSWWFPQVNGSGMIIFLIQKRCCSSRDVIEPRLNETSERLITYATSWISRNHSARTFLYNWSFSCRFVFFVHVKTIYWKSSPYVSISFGIISKIAVAHCDPHIQRTVVFVSSNQSSSIFLGVDRERDRICHTVKAPVNVSSNPVKTVFASFADTLFASHTWVSDSWTMIGIRSILAAKHTGITTYHHLQNTLSMLYFFRYRSDWKNHTIRRKKSLIESSIDCTERYLLTLPEKIGTNFTSSNKAVFFSSIPQRSPNQ